MQRPALASLLASIFAVTSAPVRADSDCDGLDKLDILAGQHVIYSYANCSQPPAELLELTRAGLVGGVVLFGPNVDNGTADAMRALKAAYSQSPAPALLEKLTGRPAHFIVMMDQEGGQVRRIKTGQPVMSAKQLGQAPDPAAAGKRAGEGAAATLREYEVNINLAPVVDVFRQPGDFADSYQRSFGNTSARVVDVAIPFIRAQQAAGVAATAKHFPGLGAAPRGANTDERSVTLDVPLDDLKRIDMAPYRAAIAAGVHLVMNSWAVYPALDDRYPPGLSPSRNESRWIKGQLRGCLGFTGVTVTDAMEVGSVAAFGDTATTAKMATNAGMDILLACSRNVSQGDVMRRALVEGLRSGELDRGDFDEATQRIAELRSSIVA